MGGTLGSIPQSMWPTCSRHCRSRTPRVKAVERTPFQTLTVLSPDRKPCWTWNGSHGLRSSFSAKVTLLYA